MKKAHHVVSHVAMASVLILSAALWSFAQQEHPTGTSEGTQTQSAPAVQPAAAPAAQPEEASAKAEPASSTVQPEAASSGQVAAVPAENPAETSEASAKAQPASGEHPAETSAATAQPAAATPAAAQKEGEHPEKSKGQPEKKGFFQRFMGMFGSEHPTGEAAVRENYTKTVEAHVEAASKKDGAFKVHDDVLNKDWMLKLKKVHKKNIAQMGENQFFACADFKEVNGKGMLDLDFYVNKTGEEWKVDKVLVHKVDGKKRFTYENNKMVPVRE